METVKPKIDKKAELLAKYSVAGEPTVGPCMVKMLASKFGKILTETQMGKLKEVVQELQVSAGRSVYKQGKTLSEIALNEKEIKDILSKPLRANTDIRLKALKKSQELKVEQITKYLRTVDFIKKQMAFLDMAADSKSKTALDAFLTPFYGSTEAGGKSSVTIEGKAGILAQSIKNDINTRLLEADLMREAYSEDFGPDIAREIVELSTTGKGVSKNPTVTQIATILLSGIRRLADAKTGEGTGFRALKDFIASWSNDPRLINISPEKWKTDSMDRLDWDRSFGLDLKDPTDLLKANKILDDFIQGAKDNPLAPGLKSSFWGGTRVFHYKTPELAYKQMVDYSGYSNLMEALDGTISRQSKAVAVEGTLGAYPQEMVKWLKKIAPILTPNKSAGKGAGKLDKLDVALKGVYNYGAIGDSKLIDVLQGTKAVAATTLLFRSIYKQPMDAINGYLVKFFMTGEMSPLNAVMGVVNTIRYMVDSEDRRTIARGVALNLDGFLKASLDSGVDTKFGDKVTGFIYKAAEIAAKLQLLTPWTRGSQVGAGRYVSTYAKRIFQLDAKLNKYELQMKQSIGLTPAEEAIVQQAIRNIPSNRDMLFLPDIYELADVDGVVKEKIVSKIGSFYYNTIQDMAGLPGWKTRIEYGTMATSKNMPDRFMREIMWTFKGPVMKAAIVMGKALKASTESGRIEFFSKGTAAVTSAALMSVAYKVAYDQFMAIAEDKDPPEVTPYYVADALKQYTLGPVSDFLLLYDSKRGQFSPSRTSVPLLSYPMGVASKALEGKFGEAAQKALNLNPKKKGVEKFSKYWMADLYLFGQNMME